MNPYNTVTNALNNFMLQRSNIAFDKITFVDFNICLNPNEFYIVDVYLFDGETVPGDEKVVYSIKSHDSKIKGYIRRAYSTYAESY